jgi:biopolymer transport protein ExbD
VRFSRRVRPEVEVNLTPLIDVVFLLLIFFMVSTTFTKESHLSIDLPEGSGDPATTSANQIEVSITRSGDFAINEVALLKNDIEAIKTGIRQVSGGDNTIPMIITADGATPHQAVITAMDAAGQLGFVQLSITTKNALPDE